MLSSVGQAVRSIRYGARPIVLSAVAVDDDVQIRVRDHGTGVPPEFVSEPFDRFTRANRTRSAP